jgi:hypothetical protein
MRRMLVSVVAALLVFAQGARADITLTYAGNAFDTFAGNYSIPAQPSVI